jgi:hypothetical protein
VVVVVMRVGVVVVVVVVVMMLMLMLMLIEVGRGVDEDGVVLDDVIDVVQEYLSKSYCRLPIPNSPSPAFFFLLSFVLFCCCVGTESLQISPFVQYAPSLHRVQTFLTLLHQSQLCAPCFQQ